MPIARTSIIRGPAIVQFNSQTFYAKDGVRLSTNLDTFEIMTSTGGKEDERVSNRQVEVTFTPAGEAEALTTLWPYGATSIGTSIYTGTDKPLVIWTLAGQKIEFKAAAITKMPDIILAATKTMIGDVTFTCIGADNVAWTTNNSFFEITSSAFPSGVFDVTKVLTQPYKGVWGASSPWSDFQTKEGFVVGFNLSLSQVETDTDGLVDMTMQKLDVNARCAPVGVTESQLLVAMGLQNTGNSRGRSLSAGGADLVISPVAPSAGSIITVTINQAQFKQSQQDFDPTNLRVGNVEFVATNTYTGGSKDPLFTIALT